MKQKSINIVLRSFICLIIIFNNYSLRAQSTAQEFFEDAALCGKNYILIQNFNKDNPIYTDNNIEVTVNSYVSHTSAPIPLLDIITNLSDTNCFKLIDPVIRFDNTTTSWRMYEMRNPYQGLVKGDLISLNAVCTNGSLDAPHFYFMGAKRTSICGNCTTCLNHIEMNAFYQKFFREFLYLFYNDTKTYSAPVQSFSSLLQPQKDALAVFIWKYFTPLNDAEMGNFISYLPSVLAIPMLPSLSFTGLCSDRYFVNDKCECLSTVKSVYGSAIEKLKNDWNYRNLICNDLTSLFGAYCGCGDSYQNICTITSNSVVIQSMPLRRNHNAPYLVLRADNTNGVITTSIAIATNPQVNYLTGWSYQNNIPIPISFNSSTKEYSYDQGWNELTDFFFSTECPIVCDNCISTFSPKPGDEYVLSTWAREESYVGKSSFSSPEVYLDFQTTSSTVIQGPFKTQGNIIDGWQKIETKFIIPSDASRFSLRLESLIGDSYFDDIRIQPVAGAMKTYVFDPISRRLMSILDENNYATFFEYDEDGKLIRTKKETERGIMTIQENKSSLIKKL